MKGQSQDARNRVFTQIDSKAGGAAVPMRCVQDAQYGYIFNPFSDGEYWYRNNNEGKTMAAMNVAAKTDPSIQARIDLFRYRVPEELYDLKSDPDCLHNLIDDPTHAATLSDLQGELVAQMSKTQDPMLAAFQNRDNRAKVKEILEATYGPQGDGKRKAKKTKSNKTKRKANRK